MTTTPTIDPLPAREIRRALAIRDLTDPAAGPHAIQHLVRTIETEVQRHLGVPVRRRRANPVVPVEDNYERLGYGPDAVARDARYSRYVTTDLMLRAHTSAIVPLALDELAADPPSDVILSCPGIVYRRDAIDRRHVGEPHQHDVWRIATATRLAPPDLDDLVGAVLTATVPGHAWRTVRADHPYTRHGLQVDVRAGDDWVEVGECGIAHPDVLRGAGLADATGLASGWGLDRLLMIRKGIDDIRLLRSRDKRVATQMTDLDPYRPVSAMPATVRDVSVAVSSDADTETIGDRVRSALGADAELVEAVEVVTDTPGHDVPAQARERLGMRPDQRNLLVRLTLRALDRSLTAEEANRVRDRAATAIHDGARWY